MRSYQLHEITNKTKLNYSDLLNRPIREWNFKTNSKEMKTFTSKISRERSFIHFISLWYRQEYFNDVIDIWKALRASYPQNAESVYHPTLMLGNLLAVINLKRRLVPYYFRYKYNLDIRWRKTWRGQISCLVTLENTNDSNKYLIQCH